MVSLTLQTFQEEVGRQWVASSQQSVTSCREQGSGLHNRQTQSHHCSRHSPKQCWTSYWTTESFLPIFIEEIHYCRPYQSNRSFSWQDPRTIHFKNSNNDWFRTTVRAWQGCNSSIIQDLIMKAFWHKSTYQAVCILGKFNNCDLGEELPSLHEHVNCPTWQKFVCVVIPFSYTCRT